MSRATFPVPASTRHEPPTPLTTSLVPLTAYRTSDGYWVLLPSGTMPPAGHVAGGFVQGAEYNTLAVGVTGRRMRRATAGMVFFR